MFCVCVQSLIFVRYVNRYYDNIEISLKVRMEVGIYIPFPPAVVYRSINNILFLQIRSNVISTSSHGHLKNGHARLLLGLLDKWILIIIP